MTSKEFFNQQAPAFNFELNEDELVAKALTQGVIVETESGYKYSDSWLNEKEVSQ